MLTLRVHLSLDPSLRGVVDRPWVLAFWHGTQFSILAWRGRKPTVVLVSLSADGAMQARALATLGLRVVRGSTSRAGARGLAALIRAMKRDGVDAAFAVDGLAGPARDRPPRRGGRGGAGGRGGGRAGGGGRPPRGRACEDLGPVRGGVAVQPGGRDALGRPIEPAEDGGGAVRAIAAELAPVGRGAGSSTCLRSA